MSQVFIWSFDCSHFVFVHLNPKGGQKWDFALGHETFKSSHVHTYKKVPSDFINSHLSKSMMAVTLLHHTTQYQWAWMTMVQKLTKE